ncbi:DNA-3-methyladenine glycosylase I [Fastidiosibacter lacustris]|uniref:DNA-3-methyladenine glycosylase I n=1 Tax=Fastidiosibacter lacustris TaxID=2056695 RepID=UPI000E3536B2|nr:DNA-3-methyladenine glycosylase I [Fastidiosibacter lacustris]
MKIKRCLWAEDDSDMIAYHDDEWGIPLYDEQRLFEFLSLEGAQAGLSWKTILKRREAYQKAFHCFEISKVALMSTEDMELLLTNSGIIRNRLKVKSVINNARCWLKLKENLSVVEKLWTFSPENQDIYYHQHDVPAFTDEAQAMSKWLKLNGFTFVGPKICYAFMQATGMVNDHIKSCYLSRTQ